MPPRDPAADASRSVQDNLLIFGASARAAAQSALRAGLHPWCADLFADEDLRACAPTMRLPGRYPEGFADLVATDLPGPWMYTGGLENWPALVERMARRRPLWGNGLWPLVDVRNPRNLHNVLHDAGLPTPATLWDPKALPPDVRWLVKPLRASGGSGIRFWAGRYTRPRSIPDHYFQEFLPGEPCAALYVGDGKRARFLGLTRQIVGEPWLHAGPFRYCGSIGPLDPAVVRRPNLTRLGNVLAGGCRLRGLFGVDGVLSAEGTFSTVEVNPRYTASVEVLEHALDLKALALHRLAFTAPDSLRDVTLPSPAPDTQIVGKAILFARESFTFPAEGPWRDALERACAVEELPAYADIPHAGQEIEAGHPVLTFFTRADTVAGCQSALEAIAGDLDRLLWGR
jgi:predicted ATP-grasp superfamily ATP-dependent carboligase